MERTDAPGRSVTLTLDSTPVRGLSPARFIIPLTNLACPEALNRCFRNTALPSPAPATKEGDAAGMDLS